LNRFLFSFLLVQFCCNLGCAQVGKMRAEPRTDRAMEIQATFLERSVSDEEIQRAFDAIKQLPAHEDAKVWVRIVRDKAASDAARRLAFLAFAERFIKPGLDIGEIVRLYRIQDWFESGIEDVTNSSQTPLDDTPEVKGASAGIYGLLAPKEIQPPRNDLVICFTLRRRLQLVELLDKVRTKADGSLTLMHVIVHEPEDY